MLVAGSVVIYAAGFLLWYSATPLGLFPVLDAREILELAERIAARDLPAEPFYRAPLYPALLALGLDYGWSPANLAFDARLLNGLLHLASAALVWRIATLLWRCDWAAALSASLYGLYPVALHFAGDALDITLAITLMLAGIERCVSARIGTTENAARSLGAAGLLLALATAARPQMLMLVPIWMALAVLQWRARDRAVASAAVLVLPILIVFAAQGAINLALGHSFRVTPWQGAFNLWAANHSGANGRYFEQQTRIGAYDDDVNPARLEAERLYRAARPGAATDPDSMSRYWHARIAADIAADPLRWLRLLAAKAWYLANNFEQYNNKTYHFHKAQSPWLRWNPLCWALVFATGVAGILRGWREPGVRLLALFMATYAAGLLLTYVSDRFRLPLVPLLAIAAGGIVELRPMATAWRVLVPALAVLTLAMTPLSRAERERTVVQDYLLQARAEAMLGFDLAAERDARAALALSPGHEAARELICVARFNHWLRGAQARVDLSPLIDLCLPVAEYSPPARRLLGVAYWRSGRERDAVALWTVLVDEGGSESDAALAALIMVGRVGASHVRVDAARKPAYDPLLLLALAQAGHREASRLLRERMSEAEIARQSAETKRTFARGG